MLTFAKGTHMLTTVVIVVLILWLLGVATAFTAGGLIHILLVIAIVAVLSSTNSPRHHDRSMCHCDVGCSCRPHHDIERSLAERLLELEAQVLERIGHCYSHSRVRCVSRFEVGTRPWRGHAQAQTQAPRRTQALEERWQDKSA
jgi:hypothetical protein